MSEKNDLITMFMDTLDPQARFNMELAVRLDEVERSGDDEVTDGLMEVMATEMQELREGQSKLHKEMQILRGALEETISQLREYQKTAQRMAMDPTRAVQQTQSKAVGRTPSGALSRAKKHKGVYCRLCGKRLEGKHQTIFCSRKCGAKWHAAHKVQPATPRLTLKDEMLGTTVVAGEGVRQ